MSDIKRTVVIVGAGFSGSLLGIKLHRARPYWRIVMVERRKRLGRGIAYGPCAPQHLLNVPVHRMEIGLTPGFAEWLEPRRDEIADALVESGLDLNAAYVPRRLFGDYVEERVNELVSAKARAGLTSLRGEVVRMATDGRGVVLTDGRVIPADTVVLAMGNLPPRAPQGRDPWLYDTGFFIPDPWMPDAFHDLDPDEPVLLLGTGLTMVDIALRLKWDGLRAPMLAVSRRGLLHQDHSAGGSWAEFLHDRIPASPGELLATVRGEVARAESQGVPWQRVFDAARPAAAAIWNSWDERQRRQFLRHVRPRWDIHRHRMPPRVCTAIARLIESGALKVVAGRIGGYEERSGLVEATIRLRGGGTRTFAAGHVVNCTGPGADFDKIAIPLIADLRERGLARPDSLGVGFETQDCAVIDAEGHPSPWLFALGPLTRPAWWEITAVPEINLQVDRLVDHITNAPTSPLTSKDFLVMGEGI